MKTFVVSYIERRVVPFHDDNATELHAKLHAMDLAQEAYYNQGAIMIRQDMSEFEVEEVESPEAGIELLSNTKASIHVEDHS